MKIGLKDLLSIGLSSIVFLCAPNIVAADEAQINGNGSGTNNQITITINRSTQVDQSNQTEVQNSVDTNQNSGENAVQDNLGDSSVDTGDNTANINLKNEGIGTSHIESECCEDQSDFKIKGNGTDSTNTIQSSVNQSKNITVDNSTKIQNNVNVNSSTGGNKVDNNLGDVDVNTGNVTVNTHFTNANVNNTFIKVATSSPGVNMTISNNLPGSANNIVFNFASTFTIDIFNNADINNKANIFGNTGENLVNGNLGGVNINTGDIDVNVDIDNKDINGSIVEVDDCDPDKPENPDNPPVTPPGGNGGNGGDNGGNGNGGNGGSNGGSSSSGNGGQVLAASIGQVLPATGHDFLFFFTIANILMFLLGAYLRLKSGRSPAPSPAL